MDVLPIMFTPSGALSCVLNRGLSRCVTARAAWVNTNWKNVVSRALSVASPPGPAIHRRAQTITAAAR